MPIASKSRTWRIIPSSNIRRAIRPPPDTHGIASRDVLTVRSIEASGIAALGNRSIEGRAPARGRLPSRAFSTLARRRLDPGQCERIQKSGMSIYMMSDDDVCIIRRSRRFLLRLPRHRWSYRPRCGAFLLLPANSKSAPAGTDDLSIGSGFQFADGLEAVRRRLQRAVDIGWAMRRGQEHIVLGMKERAVA